MVIVLPATLLFTRLIVSLFRHLPANAHMGTLRVIEVNDASQFYLADFRDGKSEIVKDWQYCDLSALGQVSKVSFTLTSSDNGDYGMNTPAYFCLDQFGAKK